MQMEELQQLLQIQQSVFREHLGSQPGGPQPSVAAPVLNRASNAAPAVNGNGNNNHQNLDRSLSTFNDGTFLTATLCLDVCQPSN